MPLRLLLTLLILFQAFHTLGQNPAKLEKTLKEYKAHSNQFFEEIKKVRKIPTPNRILQADKILTPSQIQNAISRFNRYWDTKAALLFYHYDGKTLNCFLVDDSLILSHSASAIQADQLLQAEVNLRQSIGVYSSLSINRGEDLRGIGLKPTVQQGDSSYIKKASLLLIERATAGLLEKYSHLLICPTQNLYSFPFGVLRPFPDNRYLGTVMPISIVPNLYELVNHQYPDSAFRFRHYLQNAVLVGGPVFNPNYQAQDFYGRNKTIQDFFLQELPYTLAQTNQIRGLLMNVSTGGIQIDFLQQTKATLPNFLKLAPAADLIYIATHAFSASLHPWDSSFIAFAYEPEQQSGANFWSSRSIANQSFRARLAVLSACQTGIGQLYAAGILSLANSFYYAGAEAVVSTLWSVEDHSTFMYMNSFMKGLLEDGDKHPAHYLHRVQKTTSLSPRHWAGFIYFGM